MCSTHLFDRNCTYVRHICFTHLQNCVCVSTELFGDKVLGFLRPLLDLGIDVQAVLELLAALQCLRSRFDILLCGLHGLHCHQPQRGEVAVCWGNLGQSEPPQVLEPIIIGAVCRHICSLTQSLPRHSLSGPYANKEHEHTISQKQKQSKLSDRVKPARFTRHKKKRRRTCKHTKYDIASALHYWSIWVKQSQYKKAYAYISKLTRKA